MRLMELYLSFDKTSLMHMKGCIILPMHDHKSKVYSRQTISLGAIAQNMYTYCLLLSKG